MRLTNSFEVGAPVEAAWELLNDVPRVVPCMPGAELVEVVDENTWRAKLQVKLGPIGLQFGTDVQRTEADATARRVVLTAKAREVRGRGSADATIESSLVAVDLGTRVDLVTELALRGAVAQYGRGVVADVAAQLTDRFADCLARTLSDDAPAAAPGSAPAAPEPVGGLGLALGALWRRLVARFTSPR